jgi:hypothetical protein
MGLGRGPGTPVRPAFPTTQWIGSRVATAEHFGGTMSAASARSAPEAVVRGASTFGPANRLSESHGSCRPIAVKPLRRSQSIEYRGSPYLGGGLG